MMIEPPEGHSQLSAQLDRIKHNLAQCLPDDPELRERLLRAAEAYWRYDDTSVRDVIQAAYDEALANGDLETAQQTFAEAEALLIKLRDPRH